MTLLTVIQKAVDSLDAAVEHDITEVLATGVPLAEMELRLFPGEPGRAELWAHGKRVRAYRVTP